jgi:DNA-binding response OmpR family regulator
MSDAAKRILVIEDDRETADLIAEELTDRGYEVRVAYDGQEGCSAIFKTMPDLVLSDLLMPIMSGFDILGRLTAEAAHFRDIPFVFLTGLSGRDIELKARQLGADDFVTKPIDFDVLDTIISARLCGVARTALWPKLLGMHNRQLEALTWAARGKTSWEIAQILGLSKKTVDFHLDRARIQLGASTRIEAAIKAASGRLIEP